MSVLPCCVPSVRKLLFLSSRAPPQAATKCRFGEPFSMLKIIFPNARGSLLSSRLEARGSSLQAQALSLQVRPRPPSPRLKVPRVYAIGSRLKAPGSRFKNTCWTAAPNFPNSISSLCSQEVPWRSDSVWKTLQFTLTHTHSQVNPSQVT